MSGFLIRRVAKFVQNNLISKSSFLEDFNRHEIVVGEVYFTLILFKSSIIKYYFFINTT